MENLTISIRIEHISLGALGDSFYEYLLKAWIQSGQTDADARQMYDDAMEAIVNNIIQTSPGGLIYASDMKFERLEHKMDHLACFSGEFSTIFEENLFLSSFYVDQNVTILIFGPIKFKKSCFSLQVVYLLWVHPPNRIRIPRGTWT